MILFPAIDLKAGRCVRLLRGEMQSATIYNDDPAAQAKAFAEAGFSWLHVVDLDGAVAGRPANAAAVEAIIAATSLPVQLGGGIREEARVAWWLDRGVRRVVLGTLALREPELARRLCRTHPGRIVIGIDAKAGRVAVEGWSEVSAVPARELALRFEDAGAAAIVYTEVERDGALAGPAVEATAALAAALSTPVIASGGVASLDDLAQLKAQEASGIAGIIVGRALYDGRIAPAAALAVLSGGAAC